MWLGIDDTDSPRGGCTTWVLSEVLRRVQETGEGIHLVGAPRLVRLNPNIPWKTRGNAALSAHFGRGVGPASVRAGSIAGRSVRAFRRARSLTPSQVDTLWSVALKVLETSSDRGAEGTDPTAILSPRQLPAELYWRAVREVVPWRAVQERILEVEGLRLAAYGSGQGIVGAAASIAWPARRCTWEAIAYRERSKWGTPRSVDPGSVREISRRFPETFLNHDPTTRRVMIAPHTPCPILFGVRARAPERLPRALGSVRSGEEKERWVLFRTNQATGDQLTARPLQELSPGTSGVYEGEVVSPPLLMAGGHVALTIADQGAALACIAFEPTKELPRIARLLEVGDRVRVWGSLPFEPTPQARLRLEGVQLLRARPRLEKRGNPVCSACGGRMGSLGSCKGYRCARCRRKVPPESAPGVWRSRTHLEGTYLPTPSARRHLAPLGAPRRPPPPVYSP